MRHLSSIWWEMCSLVIPVHRSHGSEGPPGVEVQRWDLTPSITTP